VWEIVHVPWVQLAHGCLRGLADLDFGDGLSTLALIGEFRP